MLSVTNIFVKYGDRVLLDNISFVIGNRDRVGLVGRNGAGKSTTLKILAGEVRPHDGNITKPSNATIGFLHQEMHIPKGKSVKEETMSVFGDIQKIEDELKELNDSLAHRTDYESDAYADLLDHMDNLNQKLEIFNPINAEAQCERILKGLGFKQSDMNRQIEEFSGGWQMRVELAKMLLQQPDYLLLDEPTNHLDIESIIWLEGFLQSYSGAIIVISHDKQFLDNITKRTIEIELGRVYDYKANYSRYVEMRSEFKEQQTNAFKNQQKIIAQKERTISRFMAKATKTSLAQSMQKQLNKMERIEIADEDLEVMNLRFPPAPRSGQIVAEVKDLSKNFGQLSVLQNLDFQLERGEKVAFVGQNGQGKTTLAKMIVGEEIPSGGIIQLGHNTQVGYYAQNQSDALRQHETLLETMEYHSPPERRTQLRNILGAFLFSGDDADKKVSVLSGGERARLALACLLLKPINLLVLDEPTNHLDMLSKEALKRAIKAYDGALIVVSHDRDFLTNLTEKTYEFKDKKIKEYLGDINFFLEKRELDSMRDVELSYKSNNQNSSANSEKIVDEKEKKKWQREVQQAEKNVSTIEIKMKEIEVKMAAPDFYNMPDSETTLSKYKDLKQQLDAAMSTWENAQLQFESL
ncbi:MAG: ABC-F family ATP-binding cassette domain-containing protein [Saprospiraceae bacterium]|nr:ABC-F family ATP-binding cassette domain-containing protein [Saprospiraceae bacterium]